MAGSNFLERFRPLGAPGAATAAGGPAPDDLGPAAELAPVLAALAATVAECEALVADAHRRAGAELARARERAAAIRASAHGDVGAEQARAAALVLAESTTRATLEQAVAGAAGIRRNGAARVDGLAARVLDRLLADVLGEP